MGDLFGGNAKSIAAELYYVELRLEEKRRMERRLHKAKSKPNPAYMQSLPKLPFAMNNGIAHNRIKKLKPDIYRAMFTAPALQMTRNRIVSICSDILSYERNGAFAKNGRSQSLFNSDRWMRTARVRGLARPSGIISRPMFWDE